MRRVSWLVGCTLSLLTFGVLSARATSVSPIQLEMSSVGTASRAQVTITNTTSTPLPLETSLKRLELDENGTQKLSNAGSDFLIFPPQVMVPPGATQVFRVQWVGSPNLPASQSYRLGLTQIPVKMPRAQAAVQVVMSFGVLINVAPPQGLPELKVIGTGVAVEKPGKNHPTITVENTTAVHALLQQATVKISSGSWSQTLSPSEIGQQVGAGLVQPGQRRKFTLPVELPAGVTSVEASLDFRPKRP
jgi:fimbrial chaperone protein